MTQKMWRKPLDAEKIRLPKAEIHIIQDLCKGCGFCYTFCPREALEKSEKFNAKGYYPPFAPNIDRCVGCKLCEAICPEFAIHVEESAKKPKKSEK